MNLPSQPHPARASVALVSETGDALQGAAGGDFSIGPVGVSPPRWDRPSLSQGNGDDAGVGGPAPGLRAEPWESPAQGGGGLPGPWASWALLAVTTAPLTPAHTLTQTLACSHSQAHTYSYTLLLTCSAPHTHTDPSWPPFTPDTPPSECANSIFQDARSPFPLSGLLSPPFHPSFSSLSSPSPGLLSPLPPPSPSLLLPLSSPLPSHSPLPSSSPSPLLSLPSLPLPSFSFLSGPPCPSFWVVPVELREQAVPGPSQHFPPPALSWKLWKPEGGQDRAGWKPNGAEHGAEHGAGQRHSPAHSGASRVQLLSSRPFLGLVHLGRRGAPQLLSRCPHPPHTQLLLHRWPSPGPGLPFRDDVTTAPPPSMSAVQPLGPQLSCGWWDSFRVPETLSFAPVQGWGGLGEDGLWKPRPRAHSRTHL